MKRKLLAMLLSITMITVTLAGCGNGGSESSNSLDKVESQESSGESSDSTDASGTEAAAEVTNAVEAKAAADRGEGSFAVDENGNNIYTAANGMEFYVDEDGNMYKRFDDVKLTMLNNWESQDHINVDQYSTEVAEKIRQKIGVSVETTLNYQDNASNLNKVFAGGDYPDIINGAYWANSGETTTAVQRAARDGILLDLSGEIDKYNWIGQGYEIGYITQAYYDGFINNYGGPIYVLPCDISSTVEPDEYNVMIRHDVAEQLGVDLSTIKNTDQLYDLIVKATELHPKDINGHDCIPVGTRHNGNYYNQIIRPFTDKHWTQYVQEDDGTIVPLYISESYLEGLMFIWKLVQEGYMDVECFTQDKTVAGTKIGNGQYIFVAASYGSALGAQTDTGLYYSNPEMKYDEIVGPLNWKGDVPHSYCRELGKTGTPAYFFPETCANLDAALTLIDYISSREGTLVYEYGNEGEDYYFDEEGYLHWSDRDIELIENNPDERNEERKNRGFGITQLRPIIDRDDEWFGPYLDPGELPEVIEWYKVANMETPSPDAVSIMQILAEKVEGYDEIWAEALGGDLFKTKTEAAFFAETEEEARAILQEFRDYVLSVDGMQEIIDCATEAYQADPEHVYY